MVAWSSRRAHSIRIEPCDGATATPPMSSSRKLCSLSDHTSSCFACCGSRGGACKGRDWPGGKSWPLTSPATLSAARRSPFSLLKRPSEVGLAEKEEGDSLCKAEQCISLGSALKGKSLLMSCEGIRSSKGPCSPDAGVKPLIVAPAL